MEQRFKDTCLVELGQHNSWKSNRKLDSGSVETEDQVEAATGIVISAGQVYVITHGSVLVSFLSKNKKVFKRLENTGHVPGKAFQKLQVRVTLDDKLSPESKHKTSSIKSYASSLFSNSSSLDTKHKHVMGSIELIWKAERFARTIKSFLPENDWSFFEDPAKDAKSENKKSHPDDIDADMVARLLPYFILVKLKNWEHRSKPTTFPISDSDVRVGETVHMVGTPFGSMAPSVFLNSVSQGVVCNVAGRWKELIVTDARCIPGTEGGAIYQGPATDRQCLLGLVVSALCWKANEWIGMSIACSIGEILQSLNRVIQLPELNACFKETAPGSAALSVSWSAVSSRPQPSTESVVLVKNGGSWGSGVLIDQDTGLILTCGHVVSNKHAGVKVRVDHPSINWYDADILYATPVNQTFDIGVIQLRDFPCGKVAKEISIARSVKEGEGCYVVGHALFPDHHNLQPSMTSGVVAKVIRSQGSPVLLQSTCTVNAGASGGPLISSTGQLLGIVACNAKDTASGASYPNINLGVPMETIWPVVQQYLQNRDFNGAFHSIPSKL